MFGALIRPLARPAVRRVALAAVVVAVAVVTWCCRGSFVHRADAQPAPAQPPAPAPTPAPARAVVSDYADRVVAYIHKYQPITRQDLGEFLVARHGADKLPLLVNKRILDHACRQHNIVVTAAEIESALADELKGLAMSRKTFLDTVLKRYKKNLYEFKEDILRPRLQLTRLVQPTLTVSEDELRKAYDSAWGEKVECRLILWPAGQEQKAMDQYASLRDSEAAFAAAAQKQPNSGLASTGGRIKPISRYSMDPQIEAEAFKLQPGQVSTLIKTSEGTVMLRCDRRIPADTTVNFDAVRDKVAGEIRERKLHVAMGQAFQTLRQQANPVIRLQKTDRPRQGPTPPPDEVVATFNRDVPITREELGEFLIARFGAEKLEYLVNRRILDLACKEKNITISEEEVDQALASDLKPLNLDRAHFEKDLLSKWGKTLYEWREDVIKTRLMLQKLCQGRVKWTEDELRKCFEAHYGERLECRMVLYPPDQERFARSEYERLRSSEAEFDRKARSQPSPTLAQNAGKLPPFGRFSLGDDNLEREAFRLQPGEVSPLVGTPQGLVVLKCDKRIPPDDKVKMEQVREQLIKETREKKMQIEMHLAFNELRKRAEPQLLLQGTGQPEDLMAEMKKLNADLPPLAPAGK